MLNAEHGYSFKAYFSATKLVIVELIILSACILPNIPGFGRRVHYMAFYADYPLIKISASVLLGAIFLTLIPLLFRAINGKPALEITDEKIVVRNASSVSIHRSEIFSIKGPDWQDNLSIRYAGGRKSIMLVVSLYREPSIVVKELRKFASE